RRAAAGGGTPRLPACPAAPARARRRRSVRCARPSPSRGKYATNPAAIPDTGRVVDVVVVGAGFAGLTAARELTGLGYEVVVFEGRDRVGGRSYTATLAGVPVDLGATFVGPGQTAVTGLAAELGCPRVGTYHQGNNLILWRGRLKSYRSTIPTLSILELLDVSRIQWRFERLCRQIPVGEPWRAPAAHRLDTM